MKGLKKIFGKYVGQTLLDPDRKTTDIDFVLWNLEADAIKNGLFLRMDWDNKPAEHPNAKRLNVKVETGTDGQLRVKRYHLG